MNSHFLFFFEDDSLEARAQHLLLALQQEYKENLNILELSNRQKNLHFVCKNKKRSFHIQSWFSPYSDQHIRLLVGPVGRSVTIS